jgi:hypothetical protein
MVTGNGSVMRQGIVSPTLKKAKRKARRFFNLVKGERWTKKKLSENGWLFSLCFDSIMYQRILLEMVDGFSLIHGNR